MWEKTFRGDGQYAPGRVIAAQSGDCHQLFRDQLDRYGELGRCHGR